MTSSKTFRSADWAPGDNSDEARSFVPSGYYIMVHRAIID